MQKIHKEKITPDPGRLFEPIELFLGGERIENTPASWMVVSFPTRNLANRKSDIFANYKDEILSGIRENNWDFQIVGFHTEKVFLIEKGKR